MLLTLSANSLRSLLLPSGRSGKAKLDLLDLPALTREELGLHGLTIYTENLAGAPRDKYDRLRERADKAGCACLLLVESEPQALGDAKEDVGLKGVERLTRVIQAGSILGCNAVAVRVTGPDDPATMQRTVDRLKKAVERAEKLEMNVLIWPGIDAKGQPTGLTATPERVTEIIKKVGGFRVGTLPDFQIAAASADPVSYMRRMTPYASALLGATQAFTGPKGAKLADDEIEAGDVVHAPFALEKLVEAVLSVGYDAALSIEYRGTGDAKLGVKRTKAVLERLLGLEPDFDEELDGELPGDEEEEAEGSVEEKEE